MSAFRRRGRGASREVGVAVLADRLAAVALERRGEERPRVVAWDVLPASGAVEIEQALRRFVEIHALRGATCRLTLPASDYNLKLVERPANVPEAELADATRWLIRDLVEIDVETAAIGVLTIPDQRGRARTPHMFVAVVRDEAVSGLARIVSQVGLRCGGFEVVESAMLALEASLPEAVAGGAMVRIDVKSSVLTLSSEGKLFLARPLRVDAATMEEAADRATTAADAGDPEILSLLEPLLLDVQRSLDYYESEYGRAPATRLSLLPGSIDLTPLAPTLAEALRPLRVEAFALEHAFDFETLPPARQVPEIALACAAAVAGESAFGPSLIPRRLRVQSSGFGLARVLQAAAALIVLLTAHAGWLAYQLHGDQRRLEDLAGQEAARNADLAQLTAEAEAEGAIASAPVDPVALRAHRDARLALLRDLGQRPSDRGVTFSTLLSALARQDLEGVWLERIAFSEAGDSIELTGRALRAEDVPEFLRRLREEPVFAGRKFGRFQIERAPATSTGLRFFVATRGVEPDAPGGDR